MQESEPHITAEYEAPRVLDAGNVRTLTHGTGGTSNSDKSTSKLKTTAN